MTRAEQKRAEANAAHEKAKATLKQAQKAFSIAAQSRGCFVRMHGYSPTEAYLQLDAAYKAAGDAVDVAQAHYDMVLATVPKGHVAEQRHEPPVHDDGE